MKIDTKAVHVGERKKAGAHVPSITPIHTASTYVYENTQQLDRIFGQEIEGQSYSRYGNPTNDALEELLSALENGAGALACSSGMMAIQVAILAALLDRRKAVLAASAIYGATIKLLTQVLEPFGIEVRFADVCDLDAFQAALDEQKPGCVFMETISNPLLRVGEMDRIAEMTRATGAALIVDNTFATPMLVQPLDQGAHLVVHSLTKYLAGHGDVLGGAIVCDDEHLPVVRQMSRTYGPVLGPFESYLTMRGIKTFPLRMERQCANAAKIAGWLEQHPGVERVFFPGDPRHPDAAAIARLFPCGLYGAMVSFELKGASKQDVFAWMDRLGFIVRGTSLGDVHSMVLYPVISSHRDVPPKQRERMGIRENLVRLSLGIEDADDIVADLERAFA